ncbi:MAG: ribonuclease H-like YkuK family protein [Mycobacterium leprae]
MQEGQFFSPTRGALSYEGLVQDLLDFVAQEPDVPYRLIVGTDSHTREALCFVTAIVIHRIGKGARFYYHRHHQPKIRSLRLRILHETALSLTVAERLTASLINAGAAALNVEVHLDVGQNGATKELIRDLVGMVTGSGFHAEIKPNAYGASKVADRYTK